MTSTPQHRLQPTLALALALALALVLALVLVLVLALPVSHRGTSVLPAGATPLGQREDTILQRLPHEDDGDLLSSAVYDVLLPVRSRRETARRCDISGFHDTGMLQEGGSRFSFECLGDVVTPMNMNLRTASCSSVASVDCGPEICAFPSCTCTASMGNPFAQISCQGITAFPDGLPLETRSLSLDGMGGEASFPATAALFRQGSSLHTLALTGSLVHQFQLAAFDKLTMLTALQLSSTALQAVPWRALPDTLEAFIIEAADLRALINFDSLAFVPNLRELALNNAGIAQFRSTAQLLPSHNLRSLSLRGNQITNAFSVAANLPMLEVLDLSNNAITYVAAPLLDPQARLSTLNVADNRVSVIPWPFVVQHMQMPPPGHDLALSMEGNPAQCRAESKMGNHGRPYLDISCSCRWTHPVTGAIMYQQDTTHCPGPGTFDCDNAVVQRQKFCDNELDCIVEQTHAACEGTVHLLEESPPGCILDILNITDTEIEDIEVAITFVNGTAQGVIRNSTTDKMFAAIKGQMIDVGLASLMGLGLIRVEGFIIDHPLHHIPIPLRFVVGDRSISFAQFYPDPHDFSNNCTGLFGAFATSFTIANLDDGFFSDSFPNLESGLFDDPGLVRADPIVSTYFSSAMPTTTGSGGNPSSGTSTGSPATTVGVAVGIIFGLLAIATLAFVALRRGWFDDSRKVAATATLQELLITQSQRIFVTNYPKIKEAFERSNPGVGKLFPNIILPSAVTYSDGRLIGQGQFGSIHASTLATTSMLPNRSSLSQANSSASRKGGQCAEAVTVLKLNASRRNDPDTKAEFLTYATLFHTLSRHPYILGIHGVVLAAKPMQIIAEGGMRATLESFLCTQREELLRQQPSVRPLLIQALHKVASALSFLESNAIVHRALSLQSILVGDSLLNVRLTGFALARSVYQDGTYVSHAALESSHQEGLNKSSSTDLSEEAGDEEYQVGGKESQSQLYSNPLFDSTDHSMGKPLHAKARGRSSRWASKKNGSHPVSGASLRYCSLEVLLDGEFSVASDVYAFGVIIYEVLDLGAPFLRGVVNDELASTLTSLNGSIPNGEQQPLFMGAAERELVGACFQRDVKLRPTFASVHAQFSYTMSEASFSSAPHQPDGLTAGVPSALSSPPSRIAGLTDAQKSQIQITRCIRPASTAVIALATCPSSSQQAARPPHLEKEKEDTPVKARAAPDMSSAHQNTEISLALFARKATRSTPASANSHSRRRDLSLMQAVGIPQFLQPIDQQVLFSYRQRGEKESQQLLGIPVLLPTLSLVDGLKQVADGPTSAEVLFSWLLDVALMIDRLLLLRYPFHGLTSELLFVSGDPSGSSRVVSVCIPPDEGDITLARTNGTASQQTACTKFFELMNELLRHAPQGLLTKHVVNELRNLQSHATPAVPSTSSSSVDAASTPLLAVILRLKTLASGGALEIAWDCLEFVKVLGSGQFGEVQLMNLNRHGKKGDGQLVAVKTLLVTGNDADQQAKASFLDEMNLMLKVHHSNLLSLLHIITTSEPQAIVVEYLPNGNLEDWLQDRAHKPLSIEKTVFILYQVACGCAELARLNIVHRDIAARNVLLGMRLEAKIADYGLSREMTASLDGASDMYYSVNRTKTLPIRWVAPEVLVTQKFNTASDVYAFGMLIFEIFTRGDIPFPDLEDADFFALLRGASEKIAAGQGASIKTPLLVAPPSNNAALVDLFYRTTHPLAPLRPVFNDILVMLAPHNMDEIIAGHLVEESNHNETHL